MDYFSTWRYLTPYAFGADTNGNEVIRQTDRTFSTRVQLLSLPVSIYRVSQINVGSPLKV